MPAARHASRSPRSALAVMAMSRGPGLPPLPDAARRLQAVHLGHLHVEQDHVVGLAPERLQHLAAVAGHVGAVSLPLQHLERDLLVDDVVLGQEDAQRPGIVERAGHRESLSRTGRRPAAPKASSSAPCRWAGTERRHEPGDDAEPDGAAHLLAGRERAEDDEGQGPSPAAASRRRSAVGPPLFAEPDQDHVRPSSARASTASLVRGGDRADIRQERRHALEHATREEAPRRPRARPCRQGAAARCGAPGEAPTSTTSVRNVNRKTEPGPVVSSSDSVPPISSHRRRLIARPRPVPPYSRAWEASIWLKALNSRSLRSAGMPMPVSATETDLQGAVPGRRPGTR